VKIALGSDLHLEFGAIELHNTETADVLILSGDILVAKHLNGVHHHDGRYRKFFKECCERFPKVIYVLGNHEHYAHDVQKTLAYLKQELVYDNLGHDLYVNCLPDLPSHISIDENNNIHIDVKYNIHDIWEHEYIQVQCDTICYPIQVNTLKLINKQLVIFAKQGLSRINAKNIYDVSNKSDVYVTVHLTLQ
jgi:hypothetical protein